MAALVLSRNYSIYTKGVIIKTRILSPRGGKTIFITSEKDVIDVRIEGRDSNLLGDACVSAEELMQAVKAHYALAKQK